MSRCVECGSDVTALAPGEQTYAGFMRLNDGYHHATCLYEREQAEERYLESIVRPTPEEREAFARWGQR